MEHVSRKFRNFLIDIILVIPYIHLIVLIVFPAKLIFLIVEFIIYKSEVYLIKLLLYSPKKKNNLIKYSLMDKRIFEQ